jgi:hypothetical protein
MVDKVKELRAKLRAHHKGVAKSVSKMKKGDLADALRQIESPVMALGNDKLANVEPKKDAKLSIDRQMNQPVAAAESTVVMEKPKMMPVKGVVPKEIAPIKMISPASMAPGIGLQHGLNPVKPDPEKKYGKKVETMPHKKGHKVDDEVMPMMKAVKPRKAKAAKDEMMKPAAKPAAAAGSYRAFIKEHCTGGKMTLAEAAKLYREKKSK